eukprot:gene5847-6764_t
MGVLGRGLAQLGLEDEAADGGHLRAGVEALAHFDETVFADAQFDMPGHEAVAGAHEHRGFVLDGLDRLLGDGDLGRVGVGGDLHGNEQPWTPRSVGVRHRDAYGGGAGLLPQQVADIGHGAKT